MLKELCCLAANKAIRGDNKGSEVPVLFKTGGQVLLLLLALLLGQDLVRVSRPIGFGIRIGHADIDNGVGPAGPEATNE